MATNLNAYINYLDTARSALEFYQSVLGGELNISTFAEFQGSDSPDDANLVMHGQLNTADGAIIMAADTPSYMRESAKGHEGFSMSLSGDDDATLSGYYEALSAGGTIVQPLVEAPWGDKFGMFTDKFGVGWMVNIVKAQ
ncbi:VOC family protein [Timonella senegalensis]|jgi:PhnB protein|uniref:VOC family protein n=1 Tax=Timonella senegalensis TaxID=1465825 RepID=UPI00031C6DE7|nr:VOC family protein [Timonella senegalensis]